MITIKGKSVYGGIAIGKIHFVSNNETAVKRVKISDVNSEIERVKKAIEVAKSELLALYEKATKEVGEDNAQIFEIHSMMLDDEDYQSSIENIIKSQTTNAEYAVAQTGDSFSEMFSEMEDEYMKARAADVKDISNRLVKCLYNKESNNTFEDNNVIICATDLAPSETVSLDKTKVIAFATKHGSANSHTAILAKNMNIPALISLGDELDESFDNKNAIVDGFNGIIYIDPDLETSRKMAVEKEKRDESKRLLKRLKGLPNITTSGKKIDVFANICSTSETGAAILNDAGGIGLFRSEFLYLEDTDYPSEEKQFASYKQVLLSMGGKKVVIRTLDIGADKQIGYFNLAKEENPALGFRAIRICLTRVDIFKTQIRALLCASVFGNLSIMFPMITSVDEVKEIKKIVNEVKDELRKDKVPFDENIEMGVMIETPAAALISDRLAKEVDFFSVGTNDLTQYTIACDRQNPLLDKFYNPHHEAVLKLIEMACKNAHDNGIWIGICGELGSDLALTNRFLEMGIDELSVSPSMVLPLREKIRSL